MAFASRSKFQLSALALALASIGAPAATINWANDADGLWTLPINWTPVGLPGSGDDVVITNVTGLKTITHNVGNDTIHSLTTNASALVLVNGGSTLSINNGASTNGGVMRADGTGSTIAYNNGSLINNGTLNAINSGVVALNNLTVSGGTLSTSSGGTISIGNGTVLDGSTNGTMNTSGSIVQADNITSYLSGAVHNTGDIHVGANSDMAILNGSNLTLTGAGTLTLAAGNSRLFAQNGSATLTNSAGHTIQGVGQVGANQLNIVNQGVITANVAGGTLTLDPTDNPGLTNTGTLRAENGGTLLLLQATYKNVGGTVAALNGSTVTLTNSGVLQGGTLATSGTGQIVLANSAFLDGASQGTVANTGALVVADNNVAYIAGTINNTGTITIGTNSDLHIQGTNNLTLAGNGTVTMVAGNSRLFGDQGGDVLTNSAGHTIQGQGQVGVNQTVIVNQGLITANVSGATLLIDPTDAAGLTNTGTLRAENGGQLTLTSATYNNNGGTIEARAGSAVLLTNSTIQGGTLTSTGTGSIHLQNSAVLDGLTNGAITNTASNLVLDDNQVGYILGAINNTTGISIGTNADLRVQGPNNLSLNGNGTLTLTASNSRLYGDQSGDIITNTSGHTIQGVGQIGINQAFIVNQGLITANQNGQVLQIDPTDGTDGVINSGTLRADNGGQLNFLNGTFNNQNGTIEARNGSVVYVSGSTIQGGLLTASAGNSIQLVGSSLLDGATHGQINSTGNVQILDNQTDYISGTINNTGTITIGTNADLRVQGANNLSLNGNGTITMVAGNSRLFGDQSGDIITNTSGHTIQGVGQIGINQAFIVNQGLITANQNGQVLQIDPTDGTDGVINSGTLRADNGGQLNFLNGTFNNQNGTIEARNGSVVYVSGSTIQGGLLTASAGNSIQLVGSSLLDGATHGQINSTGNVQILDNQTDYISGTINNTGTITIGTNADLRVQGANNLVLSGTGTLNLVAGNSRLFGDQGNDIVTNTANHTIQGQGQIGINQVNLVNQGLIVANQGVGITIDPTDGANGVINTGTMRADGGNLTLLNGTFNNAGGTIQARNGSAVVVSASTLQGGTLTTSSGGTFQVFNSSLLDGTTNGVLNNAGTLQFADNQTDYATGTINNTGAMSVGAATDLRVLGSSSLVLTGAGTLTLNASNSRLFGDSGSATLNNGAGHTINGQGQIGINQLEVTNAGTIAANVSGATLSVNSTSATVNQSTGVLLATNGGNLYVDKAITGTGTIQSDTGGTVTLNQAAATGRLINNANLVIGANNVTISSDYNNANFGTGNAFNNRSNISGSGLVLAAGDVTQAITGASVTNGGTASPTLTIGNVRVGGTTYNYQVANAGTTGPSIRGALETAVNGGNITDARLSGTGVTASNYGPIATGTHSGDLGVTFTAASAGLLAPLTGQAVHIANNFSNVGEQTLNIALASGAAAYNTAIGSATPSPIAFANVRVGTADTRAITVSNTQTAGAFSEDLNTAFAASSGSASSSGSLTGLVAGSSNNSALSASLNTATAGAKTGTVTLNYATAGTVAGVSNGLGTLAVGSQTIALSGNVYNAAVGSTTPSPVTVANQRVGGSNSSALTVANTAAAGNFSEALNAAFSATTGSASGAGSLTNLAAGSASSSALSVGVNTTSSGAKTGTVTIAYQSDGTGSNGHSGLSAISAGSQTVNVSGNVYQAAAGTITTAPLNFGTVQVGQVVSQNLAVQNSATGAAGFVEDLNASFGTASGMGASLISGSGSISGLVAGASSNALTVGVNTASAGVVNGSIAVNFFSAGAVNGVSNGLGTLAVGSANYGVAGTIQASANVVNQASPVINNSPIALGNVRIGSTSPTAFVSVTNQATASPQAALDANISGNAGITASGSFNLLAPGATNNTSLAVGLNTAVAGNQSGNATIAFVSDAANIGNCAPNCQLTLASQNVAVTGAVYRLANPTATPTAITVAGRVGSSAPTTAISITNTSPDLYTEGLTVTRGATSSGFTASGSITNLAAAATSTALGVTLNTTTAGTFSGTQALNYVSTGAGTDGAADLAIGSGSITLNGKVYTTAVATNNTPSVDFGIVHVGDTASHAVSLTNGATITALNDTLVAAAASASGPFTASGSVSGLTAGSTSTALTVGLNTATAGVYSGSAAFSAASHDADLSDAALASLAVSLSGQVNNYATDAFSLASGAGSLTQTGNTFILDYGTVAQNSGTLSTTLLAANTASGPADALAGSFQFLDPADFSESGFSSFLGLAAGQSTGPLLLSFSSLTVGSFLDTITLHGVGSNTSGYSGALADIQLIVRGTVAGSVTPPINGVPEPDSLILIGLGLPILFLRRGRKGSKAAAH